MISNVKCFGWKTSAKLCFSLVPWVIQIYFLMYSPSDILLVWSTDWTAWFCSCTKHKNIALWMEACFQQNKKNYNCDYISQLWHLWQFTTALYKLWDIFLITCISEIKNWIMWCKLTIDRTKNCEENIKLQLQNKKLEMWDTNSL